MPRSSRNTGQTPPAPQDPEQAAYPPPVYAGRTSTARDIIPPPTVLWWLLVIVAAGVPIGLLWWMLAPGGAFYGDSRNSATWFPRELLLALLGVLAGVFTGIMVSRRMPEAGVWRTTSAIVGSLIGSVLAWQFGTWLGGFAAPADVPAGHAGEVFGLRSYGIVLLWPLATALAAFVTNLTVYRRGSVAGGTV